MIGIVENIVLNKLKDKFNTFEVNSFPTKFDEFVFTSPKGALLLRFEDVDFQNQETLCAVYSNGSYNFTLFAGFRYLERHQKSYPFLTELKDVLNGLPILNKRLAVEKISFEAEINGDLWYTVQLAVNLPIIDSNKNLSASQQTPFKEELDILYGNQGA